MIFRPHPAATTGKFPENNPRSPTQPPIFAIPHVHHQRMDTKATTPPLSNIFSSKERYHLCYRRAADSDSLLRQAGRRQSNHLNRPYGRGIRILARKRRQRQEVRRDTPDLEPSLARPQELPFSLRPPINVHAGRGQASEGTGMMPQAHRHDSARGIGPGQRCAGYRVVRAWRSGRAIGASVRRNIRKGLWYTCLEPGRKLKNNLA